MTSLYLDESGSMNKDASCVFQNYIIAIVRVHKARRVKSAMKRFISDRIEHLRSIDKYGQMFNEDGSFHELKGSCLDRATKISFFNFLARDNIFDVHYIVINNSKVRDDSRLYDKKPRAVNYVLTLAMKYFLEHGHLDSDDYILQIDEQNLSTGCLNSLEDHLNIRLVLEDELANSFAVSYFDSSNNIFVQLADLCANLLYSQLRSKHSDYDSLITILKANGYIKFTFNFPL